MVLGKHDGRDGRDSFGIDPVEFRMMHVRQLTPNDPGRPYQTIATRRSAAARRQSFRMGQAESGRGRIEGRFKRGFGLGMSQHHGGLMGYHEGEPEYAKLAAAPGAQIFGTEFDLDADGNVTMKIALPDSGSNPPPRLRTSWRRCSDSPTAIAYRVIWGDTGHRALERRMVRRQNHHAAGRGHLQCCGQTAQRPTRARPLPHCADAAQLQMRDGVISSTGDPSKKTTFAALAKENNGIIRQTGRGIYRR